MNTCVHVFVWKPVLISFGKFLEMKLLDHTESVYLLSSELASCR